MMKLDPATFEEDEESRVVDAFGVDSMLNANGQTFNRLRCHAQAGDLDCISVRTVNLVDLLLTKQTARERDQPDRVIFECVLEVVRSELCGTPTE